jgi:hypothetical protein
MLGTRPHHPAAVAATLAATLALALAGCGGGDGDDAASGSSAGGSTTAPSVTDDGAGAEGDGTADDGGGCGGLAEAAVADIVGEVADTGTVGGEPTFGRSDGTEFTYSTAGCRFEVVVAGDDEPHEFSVSTGTAPQGVDLFDEFRATRDAADLRPVTGVGDDAFVDATFGEQSVQLVVRSGDSVLFIESDPPFGVPVAADDVLTALATLSLSASG